MSQTDQPAPDLVQELFARFGLAYYHSECLHRELCHFLAIVTFETTNGITRPRVEEKLAQAYLLSLGQVVEALHNHLPAEFFRKLDSAVKKRNFLAHHFWFERAHLMFTASGVNQMIEELDAISVEFQCLDREATALFEPKWKELGITDAMIQAAFEECLAGKPMKPLPDKRKPKKQERIVRVWEFARPDGIKPLIFESEDGCLWQLCDVGLGWTYYEQVGLEWQLNSAINQYLPASVDPRPKEAKPWSYEFRLANGAVFWVAPGRRPKTFRWGIRTTDRKRG